MHCFGYSGHIKLYNQISPVVACWIEEAIITITQVSLSQIKSKDNPFMNQGDITSCVYMNIYRDTR